MGLSKSFERQEDVFTQSQILAMDELPESAALLQGFSPIQLNDGVLEVASGHEKDSEAEAAALAELAPILRVRLKVIQWDTREKIEETIRSMYSVGCLDDVITGIQTEEDEIPLSELLERGF